MLSNMDACDMHGSKSGSASHLLAVQRVQSFFAVHCEDVVKRIGHRSSRSENALSIMTGAGDNGMWFAPCLLE